MCCLAFVDQRPDFTTRLELMDSTSHARRLGMEEKILNPTLNPKP